MKKNYLFGLTAMAAMMMFTSCSEEELVKQPQAGELAQVSINVNTPELGAATRAFGDGTTAKRLHYAVYNVKGEGENRTRTYLEDLTVDGTQEIKLKTTVDLQLVTGNTYDVIFWADADDQDQLYTLDWRTANNPTVTINYDNITCNNEGYDAFYGKITFKVEGAQTETVKLKRPFAQLNIGTNDIDEATSAGYQLAETEVEVETYETLHLWENGKDINVAEAVSGKTTVTFASSAIPSDEVFPVSGYEYMAMNYLLRPADKELTDVMFRFYSTEDELKERTYASVPLQRNWRTNIYGQLITSDVDVNVEIVPAFGENNQNNHQLEHLSIAKAEDLAAALTANKENIAVALTSDIELPISSLGQMTGGSGEYKLGGENTKNISIDLNGHKLTFTTTYWSVIGAKNTDATIAIKNGTVTSSQATGTWNSYDMAFANCNYIIEDVTFEKAVAFENADKAVSLKNVIINEEHDYYAMWITAEGQTVNIDGLEINSAGRGIKIDEQYVDAPAKVTLNIANAKFTTAKKAAIVVKSEAGADINLSNVNIAGVKADGINAVWVDENSKDHADKVTVVGGLKVVEAAAQTNPFMTPGNNVEIAAGTYKFPAAVAAGVTINCAEGTVFEGASSLNINGATVVGATFSNPTGKAVGGSINGTFKDCTFTGSNALRDCYAGETVVFENCVFDGVVYGVHFDGGENKEILFKNCTLSGFNAFAAAIKLVTFDGCTFKANGKSGYNGANLWGSAKMINTNFLFDGSVQNEWIDAIGADKTYEFSGCTINGASMLNGDYFFSRNVGTKAKVDGVVYTRAEGGYWANNGAAMVATVDALQAALANDEVKNIYLSAGDYVLPHTAKGKTVSFIGTGNPEDVKIAVTKVGTGGENCDYALDGSTVVFENITITTNSSIYIGYARCNGTYNNCVINGTYTLYGESEFNNCTFNVSGDVYNLWTWGAPNAKFNSCTFNSDGKAVLLYGSVNTNLTVNDCIFNDKGGLLDKKAAIEIGNDYNTSYNVVVNNTTVNGYEINDKGINTGTTLWANKNSMPQDKLNVVVDGVDVY